MGQKNQYPNSGPLGAAREYFAITPDDNADLSEVPRAIYVGTGGNLSVVGPGGNVLFKNVPSGTILPVATTRVRATTTTAADLVGLV